MDRGWLDRSRMDSRLGVGRGVSLGKGGQTVKHGHASPGHNSPTYISWRAMMKRCFDPKCNSYEYYGGRGITVCLRWRVFASFLADMGNRPPGTTLDRFPNKDGNYELTNCRWATAIEQARDKRKTYCCRGHLLADTRKPQWDGKPRCIECQRIRQAKYDKRRRPSNAKVA